MIIGLISCSKAKLAEPAPARLLYSPSYVFSRSVRYVEQRCEEWFILSAKHGLVHPDTLLEPYDETLANLPKRVRETWAAGVRGDLVSRFPSEPRKFLLLAGSTYARAVVGLGEIEEPLKGMGTGVRRQWLSQHT